MTRTPRNALLIAATAVLAAVALAQSPPQGGGGSGQQQQVGSGGMQQQQQGGGGMQQRRGPPPEALAACGSLAAGAACSFTSPRGKESGTCWAPQSSMPLACRPAGMGAGGPPGRTQQPQQAPR